MCDLLLVGKPVELDVPLAFRPFEIQGKARGGGLVSGSDFARIKIVVADYLKGSFGGPLLDPVPILRNTFFRIV